MNVICMAYSVLSCPVVVNDIYEHLSHHVLAKLGH